MLEWKTAGHKQRTFLSVYAWVLLQQNKYIVNKKVNEVNVNKTWFNSSAQSCFRQKMTAFHPIINDYNNDDSLTTISEVDLN